MKKQHSSTHAVILMTGIIALFMVGPLHVMAQQSEPAESGMEFITPELDAPVSEYVTINVNDEDISKVLTAYSLQTGQSIVKGPDVIADNVNVRLNNIPWQEALDVILKPHGFGYRVVGDTIVVSKLENIVSVEGIEPLASKVFNLKFLDAYDIQDVCEAQLSSRGKFTILTSRGMPGWDFGGEGSSAGGAATADGIRQRRDSNTSTDMLKSKTFVITDVPASLTALASIIEALDVKPAQILIQARFLEVNTGKLQDIGLDYIGAMENVEEMTVSSGSSGGLQPVALGELNKVLNLTTGLVDPLQTGAAGGLSQDNGLRLSHAEIGDTGMELLFAMMAADDDVNLLSAPHILTLNNQEAAILVGQKYPIIESDSNSGGGGTTTSTSLDYYENIGIQLNVIPQLCEDGYVSMIVHPAVSQIAGFESGVVFSSGDTAAGTSYPVLDIREAETQIMIQSGNTAVIGGLQSERDEKYVQKIPFIGDIPYLGRLFRREKITKEKVDLLIFLKATVIEEDAYATTSSKTLQEREIGMRLDMTAKTQMKVSMDEMASVSAAAEDSSTGVTVNPTPVNNQEATPSSNVSDEEIRELVNRMGSSTNSVPTSN